MDSKIWKKSAILIREVFFCQKSGLILKKLMFNFFRKFCWMEVWILLMRRPNWCHKRNIVWKKCWFWTFRIAVFFFKFLEYSVHRYEILFNFVFFRECWNDDGLSKFQINFFSFFKTAFGSTFISLHLVAATILPKYWYQGSRNLSVKIKILLF